MWKHDIRESNFEHVFSSHKVKLQGWRCSSSDCGWTYRPSIKSCLQGKVHTDLVKLKVEFGANHTYRDLAKSLKRLVGQDRKHINRMSIQRATKEAGSILEPITFSQEYEQSFNLDGSEKKPANNLCVVVDGGHVHDAYSKGHNFEVMVGKVYRPENVIRIDKHHTSIIEKQCASSAKSDEQASMKRLLLQASKKEGMEKTTTVTALADGAKNCWNIIESLLPYCLTIIFILDWFHIGKYIFRIKKSIPLFSASFDTVREFL